MRTADHRVHGIGDNQKPVHRVWLHVLYYILSRVSSTSATTASLIAASLLNQLLKRTQHLLDLARHLQ